MNIRRYSIHRWQRTAQWMQPVEFLALLREHILAQKQTRLPKWRFRVGDVVLQLQPQPGAMLFHGRVVRGPDIPTDIFKKPVEGFEHMTFTLHVVQPGDTHVGEWKLQPVRGYLYKVWPTPSDIQTLYDQTITALHQLNQLDANTMLAPACLFCGKALTDPGSMARFIGPECAGTSSLMPPTVRVVPAAVAA